MRRLFKYVLGAIAALAIGGSAMALDREPYVVKSDGKKWIVLQGMIEYGDFPKFMRAYVGNPGIYGVILEGPGGVAFFPSGLPADGMYIANFVIDKKLATLVRPKTLCASMCAAISLVGSPKIIYTTSQIGIHSVHDVYFDNDGNKIGQKDDPVSNSLMTWTFGRAGLPMSVAFFWAKTPGDNIFWITPSVATTLQIGYVILEDKTVDPPPAQVPGG